MPIVDQVYYDSASFKLKQYNADGSYTTVGSVHDQVQKVELVGGQYQLIFDSSFDMISNGASPTIAVSDTDSDGNTITWNLSQVTSPAKGRFDKDIAKASGANTLFSLSSRLSEYTADSTTEILALQSINDFKLEGKYGSSVPKFTSIRDSYETSIVINLEYTPALTTMVSTNVPDILGNIFNMGQPDVKFKFATDLTFNSNTKNYVFDSSGLNLFVTTNNTNPKKIDQYILRDHFDLKTLVSADPVKGTLATTPDYSFNIDSHLGYTFGHTSTYGNDTVGLALNDSGNVILSADRLHNKIYQYDLSTPLNVSTAEYKSAYAEIPNLFAGGTPSGNTNMRNFTYYVGYPPFASHWAFAGYGLKNIRGYYGTSVWDKTFHTHLSANGEYIYIMSHTEIKRYKLNIPYNIYSAIQKTDGSSLTIEAPSQFWDNTTTSTFYLGGTWWRSIRIKVGITSDLNTPQITQVFTENGAADNPVPSYRRAGYISNKITYFFAGNPQGYSNKTHFIHTAFPQCFTMSRDGTQLYMVWGKCFTEGKIRQYTLSEPWDLSTATVTHDVIHGIGQGGQFQDNVTSTKFLGPWSVEISFDGTKLFIWDSFTNYVYGYPLSTAYDLSTIPKEDDIVYPWPSVYESRSPKIPTMSPSAKHFRMNNNGSKFYIANNATIKEYRMTTKYDLSTATFGSEYSNLDLSRNCGFEMDSAETNIFLQKPNKIDQLSLTTSASADNDSADINSAAPVFKSKFLDVSPEFSSNSMTNIILSRDGTKLFVSDTNKIDKYLLSEAGQIYSATHESSFTTGFSPTSAFAFNTAEDKLYVTGGTQVKRYSVGNPLFQNTSEDMSPNEIYELTGKFNSNTIAISWDSNGDEFHVMGKDGSAVGIDTYTTKNKFGIKPL